MFAIGLRVVEKLIENEAALLMEEIQRSIPSKTAEFEERFVPSGDTQPTVVRKTAQNGEKSVYVENNLGSIIIH